MIRAARRLEDVCHLASARGSAPWLSQPFVDANFKMQQALTGQPEIKPRWKRCVELTDQPWVKL